MFQSGMIMYFILKDVKPKNDYFECPFAYKVLI